MSIYDSRIISKGGPAGLASGNPEMMLQYQYKKGEVKEYISNPADYLSRSVRDFSTGQIIGKISDFLIKNNSEENKNIIVRNPEVARYMPANSIIVYTGNQSKKPVIAYPFFPPHISLPLKPGEQVWLIEESVSEDISFYYWMCRVAGDRQIDDLNHTNIDRSTAVRELTQQFDLNGNIVDEELIYPATAAEKFNNMSIPNNESLSSIQSESIAFMEEFTSEPVPRTYGKCSDLLLQGSNNATIQLTTEKFRNSDDIQTDQFLGSDGSSLSGNIHNPLAGTIDMFVGKEKSRLLELSTSSNPENLNSPGQFNVKIGKRLSDSSALESYEGSKIDEFYLGQENINEGNDSPRNVFSRLYLGMNSTPDDSFEIGNEDLNTETTVGPSAVLYSDNSRILAENSLKLYNYAGNNFINMSENGEITIQSGEGETASKIILRPDGNIILKPGSGGVLHLGGDESELSGVAVSVSTLSSPLNGQTAPVTPGITTTMGGTSFLGDPVSGLVSSKVLIKV